MNWRIFILISLPVFALGQGQFRFDHFTIKDGLSQNTVHCVLKDKEGFYWLGTQDGLNRFDGYSVKVYRHDREDTTSISDNFILTIREDRAGNLWVGTRNGLNHFDKKKGIFTKIISNEVERTHYHASVWNIFIDPEGNIIYSNFSRELVNISVADAQEPPFHPKITASHVRLVAISDSAYSIHHNKDTTLSGFNSLHSATWSLPFSSRDHLLGILETKTGQLLLGTSKGLFVAEKGVEEVKPLKGIEGNSVNKLLLDSRNHLWVGTSEGLYIFLEGNLEANPVLLTHSSKDLYSLGSNSIQELYEDPDGLIWVGTSEGGVSVYDPQKSVFKILNHTSPVALPGNAVWGIYQDGNELWVGTNNGLSRLCFTNEKLTDIYSGKNHLVSSETFSASSSGNTVTSITKDHSGKLWMATNHNGISVYHPATKKWDYFNTKNSPLKSNTIFHLFCASDGKIWVSTLAGFYSYDPAKGSLESHLPEKKGDDFLSGYIFSMYEDSKKDLWAGSTGGVYHVGKNGDIIAIYKSEAEDPSSLSYNMATSFLEDTKGRFWIATLGGGINLFHPQTNTFTSYTKKDGLANDITYQILEDKNGRLWISTNSGISCFDPDEKKFVNYTEKDGIVSNEFCQNSGLVTATGEICFGSPDGLMFFDPLKLSTAASEVPILLTSLKINYAPVLFDEHSPVELHYGDKTVTFEFTAPDFRNQEKIQYAFRLEGFDDTWHEVPSSNRIASFTSLPFGNYTFKIRVRKGNSPWQEKQLAFDLKVIPPFWMQGWFIVFEILLILSMVVLLVRYYAQRRLRAQLREAEVQRKMHEEKERISRDLHDNVGAHLTYIITSLDNISYKMERGEKEVPQDKISSLSDFSRGTMQQLRESIWAINKEKVTLAELRDKISEYSARMAAAGNMDFKLAFNSPADSLLKPSHAINIYRVVQEAINNSVKHSQAGELSLNISKNGGKHITIEVKDNGKGMNEAGNSTGYGLRNMSDRVKELGGKIAIESGATGTKVSFTIPIQT